MNGVGTYIPRPDGIYSAFHFDGGFPLDFLTSDERVRAGADGYDCEVIRQPDAGPIEILAQLRSGDWLVRASGGRLEGGGGLEVLSDDEFGARFQRTDDGGDQ